MIIIVFFFQVKLKCILLEQLLTIVGILSPFALHQFFANNIQHHFRELQTSNGTASSLSDDTLMLSVSTLKGLNGILSSTEASAQIRRLSINTVQIAAFSLPPVNSNNVIIIFYLIILSYYIKSYCIIYRMTSNYNIISYRIVSCHIIILYRITF